MPSRRGGMDAATGVEFPGRLRIGASHPQTSGKRVPGVGDPPQTRMNSPHGSYWTEAPKRAGGPRVVDVELLVQLVPSSDQTTVEGDVRSKSNRCAYSSHTSAPMAPPTGRVGDVEKLVQVPELNFQAE
jgi:hypothetical protein